jgi:cell division protein FtsB
MIRLIIIIGLLMLVVLSQSRLWLGGNGVYKTLELKREVVAQKKLNDSLEMRNKNLRMDLQALKRGLAGAIEDHARGDLGMIKGGETFYQISKK